MPLGLLHMPKLYLPMSVQKTKSEGQMNSALEAYFAAVESEHRGTRWAFWTVVVCAGYLLVRIL